MQSTMISRTIKLTTRHSGLSPAIRHETFQGRECLVVPVVMMVGNSVIRPLGSKGPEFVPAEELATLPSVWNYRPIIPDHPSSLDQEACQPDYLESEQYGIVFAAEFRNGSIQAEAWLDIDRASEIGERASSVIAKCAAGDTVELSVGAYISLEPKKGTSPSGVPYDYVWHNIRPDHLAFGLAGKEGACSVEMGCGGPRLARNAAALTKARKPVYTGTESIAWTAPTFADYVKGLYKGDNPPKSISQADQSLKDDIAKHSLLGNPDADNLRDLTLFPVVDPRNNNLNEHALRAVLGGRGSSASILSSTLQSARDMARSLLNKEFDAKLEVATMATVNSKKRSSNVKVFLQNALRRVFSQGDMGDMGGDMSMTPTSTTSDGISDYDLRSMLWDALYAIEPAFMGIEDHYPETRKVVYCICPEGEMLLFQRTYVLDEVSGTVTLNNDKQEVAQVRQYVPVQAQQVTQTTQVTQPQAQPVNVNASTCSCNKGDNIMDFNRQEAITKLITSSACPFQEQDRKGLEALSDTALEALEKAHETQPAQPAQTPQPVQASTQPAQPVTPPSTTLTAEQFLALAPPEIRTVFERAQAEEQSRRTQLLTYLETRCQSQYTKEQLAAKSTDDLVALANIITASSGDNSNNNVHFLGRALPAQAANAATPPRPWTGKKVQQGQQAS